MNQTVRLILAALLLPVALLGLLGVLCAWILLSIPDVRDMRGCITATMHQVFLCPKEASYVPLSKVSPVAVAAVLASEDTTFYQHNGFDWFEIKNSFAKDMDSKQFARGGSTITQQLAKNVYLSGDKSVLRKLREAFLTYQIEKNFSKDEILEKYLNVVEFGPDLYGIKPAAKYYFKKDPQDLNVLESAFLAFLLPNPKSYHRSFSNKKLTPFARGRIITIAYRLWQFHKIPEATYNDAKAAVDLFPWTALPAGALTVHELSESDTHEFQENDKTAEATESDGPADDAAETADSDTQQDVKPAPAPSANETFDDVSKPPQKSESD